MRQAGWFHRPTLTSPGQACSARRDPRAPSQVDLWVAATGVGSAPLPREHLDVLSPAERQRYGRFRCESDRRAYLVSRVLLRTALSHVTSGEVPLAGWRFDAAHGGKPKVAERAGLPRPHFSVSHCRQLVAVAVSATSELGVDVECLTRPADDAEPVEAVLAPEERAWLNRRPSRTQWADFVRLWTVKEAYAKWLGRGVGLDFASFEAAIDPPRIVRTETGQRPPENLYWIAQEIGVGRDVHALSLASSGPTSRRPVVRYRVLDVQRMEAEHGQARLAG